MFFWTNKPLVRSFRGVVLAPRLWRAGSLLLLLVLAASCGEKIKRSRDSGSVYFPVDSLVTAQIRLLAAGEAQVHKTTALGAEGNTTLLTLKDTMQWIKELGVFRELDIINKPVNKNVYEVQDGLRDSRSNLTVRTYTARGDAPVKYLRLYYQDSPDKLRRLEAQFDVTNLLYKSSRRLALEFQDVYNKTVLTSYSIDGGQKIFMGDSVQYAVHATIALNGGLN
jgi:hypothetical protein